MPHYDLLTIVNDQQWGCFSIFRRRMTSRGQCPRGVCVLVNAQEWGCFSIFWRADDVTRIMSKGGGACECLHPPPSGNPRLCSTYPSSDPPPPTWMAGYGPDVVGGTDQGLAQLQQEFSPDVDTQIPPAVIFPG